MSLAGLRLTAFVAAALMFAGSPAAHFARPTTYLVDQGPKINLETMFPQQFGDWHIDNTLPVVLAAPDVQATLNAIYNQILSRTYVNKQGERIMLSVAYGGDQSDGHRAHRPEVCYPAQGFQITANQAGYVELPGKNLRVRHLMSQQGGRYEPITYWVIVGDQVAISSTEQKLAQLKFGMRGLIPDGLLVRVSSIDRDMQRGQRVQAGFIGDLAQALTPSNRAHVLGTATATAG